MHERQAVVFGLLIAFLAVCGIGALAIYTGAIEAPFARDFTTPEVIDPLADVPAPCLPEDTLPVAYSDIEVMVLNGSGTGGIANANEEILERRGFVVTGTGNVAETARTQVRFGAEGVAAAYTLAAHYENVALLLDDREGTGIDLVLGTEFERLVDPELVELDAETPLVDAEGCEPLEEITPRPGPVPDEEEAEE